MTARCPYCRQPMRTERAGVPLTPLKAGLFDAIKRAGDIGITSAELVADLYRDRRRTVDPRTIKSHVWQLNELLEDTAWIIVSDRRRWFLEKRKMRRAA